MSWERSQHACSFPYGPRYTNGSVNAICWLNIALRIAIATETDKFEFELED